MLKSDERTDSQVNLARYAPIAAVLLLLAAAPLFSETVKPARPSSLSELLALKKNNPDQFQELLRTYGQELETLKKSDPAEYTRYLNGRNDRLKTLNDLNPELLKNTVRDYFQNRLLNDPYGLKEMLRTIPRPPASTAEGQHSSFFSTSPGSSPVPIGDILMPQGDLPPQIPGVPAPEYKPPVINRPLSQLEKNNPLFQPRNGSGPGFTAPGQRPHQNPPGYIPPGSRYLPGTRISGTGVTGPAAVPGATTTGQQSSTGTTQRYPGTYPGTYPFQPRLPHPALPYPRPAPTTNPRPGPGGGPR